MTEYDPARSRRPTAESAVDAVFARSDSNGAGAAPGVRPAGPTVMPDPAPSDDVLLVVGAVAGAVVVLGAYVAYRRWRRE